MKYSFIATEGIQDVAFVSKILKELGFVRERYMRILENSLDNDADTKLDNRVLVSDFWKEKKLIPTSFPSGTDGNITEGVQLPWLWNSKQMNMGVAVQGLGGVPHFFDRLGDNLNLIAPAELFSVGIILDADLDKSPTVRFNEFILGVRKKVPNIFDITETPGVVTGNNPKIGIFIFPNNVDIGTVEDLLLDCADEVYPNVKQHIEDFIDKNGEWFGDLEGKEKKEFQKPAGKQKLAVAGISSVMKPGRAIQNTIEDCRWLCDKTMSINRVQVFVDFLKKLLDIQ